MPSLLDRLLDPASQGTLDRPWYGVTQMAEAVQRDLEELLNTHQTHQGLLDGFPEAQRSVLAYGLPDLPSLKAHAGQQREDVARAIEAVVRLFEPRLSDVRAEPLGEPDEKDRNLRFRIRAKLRVEPAPEVAFETTLELTTGHYSVRPTGP
jgi:type VI secretion system protein ImpF